MSDLIAARSTMALSLGFHIIFACVGMIMPFMMASAHYFYLKTKNEDYLKLTKMWMKGVAILFAVGAVSGTVLSFELGLLWPNFMKHAGPIIGMPFSWEGTAFFLEAVAIGLYLYGWNRLNPWLHWWTGIVVGISGFASGILVVAANSWMNSPQGFDWVNGQALNIDPVKAMFNPAWLHQTIHMQVAAAEAVGFAVAGIHAYLLLKNKKYQLNKKALSIAMTIGSIAALVQPVVGHFSAQRVAVLQPIKLAAMEGHFETSTHAPLHLGGWPDENNKSVKFSIKIPGGLSFLAFNSPSAHVIGLDSVPKSEWPPVAVTHIAFQIMVFLGTLLALVGIVFLFYQWQKKQFSVNLLKTIILTSPLGFIAIEAGWVVTEVGRQPWIIYGIMKTQDAVTPIAGLKFHFALFFMIYFFLAGLTLWLLKRQIEVANA